VVNTIIDSRVFPVANDRYIVDVKGVLLLKKRLENGKTGLPKSLFYPFCAVKHGGERDPVKQGSIWWYVATQHYPDS